MRPCSPVVQPLPFPVAGDESVQELPLQARKKEAEGEVPPRLVKAAKVDYSRHSPPGRVKAGSAEKGRRRLEGWLADHYPARGHAVQFLPFAIVFASQQT